MAAYTTIDNPELYFQTKIYAANNTDSTAITLDGEEDMSPNMIWWKNRSDAYSHRIIDTVRGVTKILTPDTTAAEATNSNALASFDSDGFTLNADGDGYGLNYANAHNIVAWCWKAGGSGSANTAGSRDTTATSANTTSGFSISTLTTDSSGADTYGHGLGAVPTLVIAKTRSSTNGWFVYHKAVGNTKFLRMEVNSAEATNTMWNDTTPTSTVFSLNADNIGSSVTAVAYSFVEKQGFSKFGSYTGNGNADGATVWCGFSPAFVLIKSTGSGVWRMWDNKRDALNPNTANFQTNASDAEYDHSSVAIDFLSSGFKARSTDSSYNGSGTTYVYMAFAEAPFVNSNGVPCTAR